MRERAFLGVVFLAFATLILGLFYAQIIRGPYYSERAKMNSVVVIPLEAPRGKIMDRNNKIIVDNRTSYDLSIIYRQAIDVNKLVPFLTSKLNITRSAIFKALTQARERPFTPTVIAEDIGKENAVIIEQARVDYPGFRISTKPRREYKYGAATSALTGYLGMIREDELERYKIYGYRSSDWIGRSGLERKYDAYLRGTRGGMQIETDSRGRQKRVLSVREAVSGKSLYTTIDIDLQDYCDKIFGQRNGCIIIMNVENGQIYAYVSHPDFDPNIFVTKDSVSRVRSVLRNENRDFPLLDRVISCSYPPGSIFKLVVASAALDSGKCAPETSFTCGGVFNLGNTSFKCWKAEGHGVQNLYDAIQNSCNVFFYQLGLRAGVDLIALYAERLGFGKPTGIDLYGEISGVVPNPKWKLQHKKDSWYEGDTVNYSIGQGFLLATPMQVIRMVAAVANGGYLVKPYIVEKIDDVQTAGPRAEKINVRDRTLEVVKEGMFRVVNNPSGTGKYAKVPGVNISGKTGTAQNPKGKAHGWFAGFAPSGDPKIAVVVFVEYGGKGGLEASKIARSVFEKVMELRLLR